MPEKTTKKRAIRAKRRGRSASTLARDYVRGEAAQDTRLGRRPGRKPSPARARAAISALRREGRSAASHRALSRQARSASKRRGAAERSAAARKAARTRARKQSR